MLELSVCFVKIVDNPTKVPHLSHILKTSLPEIRTALK